MNIHTKYMPERMIVFQACRATGSMPLLTHEERRKMLRDQQRAPTAPRGKAQWHVKVLGQGVRVLERRSKGQCYWYS